MSEVVDGKSIEVSRGKYWQQRSSLACSILVLRFNVLCLFLVFISVSFLFILFVILIGVCADVLVLACAVVCCTVSLLIYCRADTASRGGCRGEWGGEG
jgi:hypothetical protein